MQTDKSNLVVRFIYSKVMWTQSSVFKLADAIGKSPSAMYLRMSDPMRLTLRESMQLLDALKADKTSKREFWDAVMKQYDKEKKGK